MIRLLFTKAPGFVAAVIRFVTRSEVSHVGIQIGPNKVIQADKGGVQESTLDQFLCDGRRLLAAYEAKPETEPLLDVDYAKQQLGDKYDYIGLVGDALPILAAVWFKIKVRNPFARKHEYWCSEFVLTLDKERTVPELNDLDPSTVSPGELLNAISNGKSFREINLDLVI